MSLSPDRKATLAAAGIEAVHRSEMEIPREMGRVVISACTELQAELSSGALVTINTGKRRARILPL